jgi:2-oxoisovalerate dehydrogenase E1 component
MISRELFGELAAPVERLAPVYAPIPFAAELENALFPDAARIVDLIRSMA